MVYTKDIVIGQLRFKYKITELQALRLYEAYEKADTLSILIDIAFRTE